MKQIAVVEEEEQVVWLEFEPSEDKKKRSKSRLPKQTKKLSYDDKIVDDTRSEERALRNSRKNYTRKARP